ncbi:hypothetical protein QTV44_002544 [Vibrio vulnificus]|nr:hypothetical protein [Vibrio vulnificus]
MVDIVINLDQPLFVPRAPLSLADMVRGYNRQSLTQVTCVTQESDGELLFWSAPIEQVEAARTVATLEGGLMPLVGFDQLVSSDYYLINGQEVVASDWENAVVKIVAL